MEDLDIPIDDIECWNRYPKHRWVYDTTRLFDAQQIKWSPFKAQDLPDLVQIYTIHSSTAMQVNNGFIHTKIGGNKLAFNEVYIAKGEVKLIRQIDTITNTEVQDIPGDISLKLNAFASLHFNKFNGVISVTTRGIDITSIQLRPYDLLVSSGTNTQVTKLKRKIYKKAF